MSKMQLTISKEEVMTRIVGFRKQREISLQPSAILLEKAMKFNDEIHQAFERADNGIRKGVYRFKSHEEANKHQEEAIAQKMARLALTSTK